MGPTTDRTGGITRVLVPALALLALIAVLVLPARLEASDGDARGGSEGRAESRGHGDDGGGGDDREGREVAHHAGDDDGDDGRDDGEDDDDGDSPPATEQSDPDEAHPQAPPPATAPAAGPPPTTNRRRARRTRPSRGGADTGRARGVPSQPPTAHGSGAPAALPGRLAAPTTGAPRRAAASDHPRTRRARRGAARGSEAGAQVPAAPAAPAAPAGGRRRGPAAAVGLALAEPTSGRPLAGVEPLLLALLGVSLLLAAALLRPQGRDR
jgi:hypothetical protein